MVTPELLEYIKTQVAAGVDFALIEKALLENKWPQEDITKAIAQFSEPIPDVKTEISTPEVKDKSPLQLSFTNSKPWWKNYKILLIAASVIMGLVLIGGGVWAYVNIYNSPERTIVQSIQAFQGVKNITYDGQMKIQMGSKEKDNSKALKISMPALEHMTAVNVVFNGIQDLSATDSKKGLIKFEISGKDQSNQEVAGLGLEARFLNKALYTMLLKATFNQPGLDMVSLTNQWVKFDLANEGDDQTLKQMAGGLTDNKSLDAVAGLNLSASDILSLAKIYYQTKPLAIKKLANEKIDGVTVYHYSWQLDEAQFKEFMKQVYEIYPKDYQEPGTEEKFLASLEKPLAGLISGELWIAKDDSLLRRFSFKYIDKEDPTKVVSALIDMNYNTTVSIEEPTPFKTMEEILGQLLGGMAAKINGENMPTNSELDTDGDGLIDQQETLLGTDKNKIDTDGDGYSDKQEIDGGYNPLGPGKLNQ